MKQYIVVHDLVDPDDLQGRTYKEVNLEKRHQIKIGAFVKLTSNETDFEYEWEGIRLYVCKRTRDCDGTPLYSLGFKGETSKYNMHHGFSEECLEVIKNPV